MKIIKILCYGIAGSAALAMAVDMVIMASTALAAR